MDSGLCLLSIGRSRWLTGVKQHDGITSGVLTRSNLPQHEFCFTEVTPHSETGRQDNRAHRSPSHHTITMILLTISQPYWLPHILIQLYTPTT
jgi:hypothetical protein